MYSFANEALTYESETVVFVPIKEAILQPTSPKIAPKSVVKKEAVQSTSKKQIKGKKFFPAPTPIKEMIVTAATKRGVDPIIMEAISFCESDYVPKATNKNNNASLDVGVAAINDFHLPELKKLGLDRENPQDAYEFMAILIARNGLEYSQSDYRHSKECWDVAVKVARN